MESPGRTKTSMYSLLNYSIAIRVYERFCSFTPFPMLLVCIFLQLLYWGGGSSHSLPKVNISHMFPPYCFKRRRRDAQPEPESKPKPKSEPEPESKRESESRPKSGSKPKPKPKPKPNAKRNPTIKRTIPPIDRLHG